LKEINTSGSTAEKPVKIWNVGFLSVFVANACMYLAQQMMNSLIAKYADHLGAAPTIVGLVTSLFALTALIFKIISGPAIDTFNRRYILTGAMFVMATAFFGYSFSYTIPSLVCFRLLQGAGQAFTATCCLALAADTLPTEKFATGIGIFSMAQSASQAIGPTVALTFVDIFGYNITFAIGAFIMLAAVVFAYNIKIKFTKTKPFKISIDNIIAKEAILPAIIIFFLSMAYCVINSFLIIFAGIQKVDHIGYYFTVYALTLLFTRPTIGKLIDRFGLVRTIIPAMICFMASFLLISISNNLFMFLIASFISAFGFGACQPAVQTLSMKCVPKEFRGAASSTNYIGNDLGNLAGPMAAGLIIEISGYASMWRLMLIPVLIALIIVLIFRKTISSIEINFKNNNS
jgi:MFS family permease